MYQVERRDLLCLLHILPLYSHPFHTPPPPTPTILSSSATFEVLTLQVFLLELRCSVAMEQMSVMYLQLTVNVKAGMAKKKKEEEKVAPSPYQVCVVYACVAWLVCAHALPLRAPNSPPRACSSRPVFLLPAVETERQIVTAGRECGAQDDVDMWRWIHWRCHRRHLWRFYWLDHCPL